MNSLALSFAVETFDSVEVFKVSFSVSVHGTGSAAVRTSKSSLIRPILSSERMASSSRSELYLWDKSEQPDTVVEAWRLILLETVVEEGLSSD